MKRMLLMLLPLLCLAGTGAVHAQKWQLKVGGGLASQGVHNRVVGAYKIGVAYEYEFDQHWTFSPGLMFYGKGWRTPDESVACVDDDGNPMLNEAGQQVYSLMSRSASANYVEVPLLFNYYYRLAESRYVVLSAGPYVAFGVAGKIKTKGTAAASAVRNSSTKATPSASPVPAASMPAFRPTSVIRCPPASPSA